ncbi:P-loop containing nucleoside triphosphate hydrolase protein [Lactarius pseudohatsudake]|nr:P-loop containing nucleoside triphosphate hydrolase protein [Lactarius pseudohatsudake]
MLPSLAAWWRAVWLRSQGTRARADRPRDIEDDEKLRWGMHKSGVRLSDPTTSRSPRSERSTSTRLSNVLMQLRKSARTRSCSKGGACTSTWTKMMVLERLLNELFARGHKAPVFSQFVTSLDVIEDWARECKKWQLCRIDGSTGPLERRAETDRFQRGAPDAPRLFLLSTRAGRLGINLTAADAVVFYSQDWLRGRNPQMDLQAQDRAHRIGQTRPVPIFRLVSRHTIESKILQRASEKRQLEALVIAKGSNAKTETRQTIAEMAAHLLELEGEHIEVVLSTTAGKRSAISDAELDILLDRRKEVFEGRGVGWKSGAEAAKGRANKGAHSSGAETPRRQRADADSGLFEVYKAPVDEGNDALAHMLGEDASASL